MKPKSVPLEIAISRHDESWSDGLDPLIERAILAAVQAVKPKITGAAEISVVLTDDAEQRELNRQYRNIDGSTNVLSFPQIEPHAPVSGLLGDIVLARETVEREALNDGISLPDHVAHLVVHGFLHVLGYDHLVEDEALHMEGLETQILASLGIADPYAEDGGPSGRMTERQD